MPTQSFKRKRFVFLDDDSKFLELVKEMFSHMSGGAWDIAIAENHSRALDLLCERPADAVVVDFQMPVMDGLQFLRLLGKSHPGQKTVIWSGYCSPEARKACAEAGASLYLEKVPGPDSFKAVFAALDSLTSSVPQDGFRGVMRRVGLQEVLQMECLGRKSSVLEVLTGKSHGRIYLKDGEIIHAEFAALQGEVALYSLLALRGGEFNLLPFSEPARQTISGQYEFLLMEAARLKDEASEQGDAFAPPAEPAPTQPLFTPEQHDTTYFEPAPSRASRIDEILLCSGTGEVLYDWQLTLGEKRTGMLTEIGEQAGQVAQVLQSGCFDRLEITTTQGRIVCQVQPHLRLFVRSTHIEPAAL